MFVESMNDECNMRSKKTFHQKLHHQFWPKGEFNISNPWQVLTCADVASACISQALQNIKVFLLNGILDQVPFI